jgi:hypothetical protein
MSTNLDERLRLIQRKQTELAALAKAKFTPPHLDDDQRRGVDAGMLQLITDIREIRRWL